MNQQCHGKTSRHTRCRRMQTNFYCNSHNPFNFISRNEPGSRHLEFTNICGKIYEVKSHKRFIIMGNSIYFRNVNEIGIPINNRTK